MAEMQTEPVRPRVELNGPAPDFKANAKLTVHQVDFARLPAAFPSVDHVFIALGTTIKVAGSEAVSTAQVRQAPTSAVVVSPTGLSRSMSTRKPWARAPVGTPLSPSRCHHRASQRTPDRRWPG